MAVSGIRTGTFISFPAEARRCDKAIELLQRFGLADRRPPDLELAGGVRITAMALVRRPKLLLLDEPTSGVRRGVRHHGSRDRARCATIVFVEHDMRSSAAMPTGWSRFTSRIPADGDPRDVLKDPEVRRYVTRWR